MAPPLLAAGLPPSDVLFVDDAPSLDILVDRITRATTAIPLLGLDVEWRPEIFGRRRAGRGRSNRRRHGRVLDDTEEVDDPYDDTISGEVESATTFSTKMMMATDVMDVVSILQLATREWAAVLDLQRVVSLPAFAHVRRLLQDDNIVKLGFDAGGDLKRLRRAYPDEVAFVDCGPWVDIQILTAAAAARRGNNRGDATPPSPTPIPIPIPIPTGAMSRTNRSEGGTASSSLTLSLSTAAEMWLGQPLDKLCQVSDWGRRPLTARQLTYAAQDAHVLVRIYNAVHAVYPDLAP